MASEKRGDLGSVLVIGGNGFLGHHIVNQALSSWTCSAVASVDLRCTRNINAGASYHECDITDAARLTQLLQPELERLTLAGFLRAYDNNKSHIQLGDNTNIFDFTYVGNVAHAHLLAARLLLATAASPMIPLSHERVDGEIFFVTNDSPVYFWDFARAVWRAAGNDKGTDGVWEISRGMSLVLGSASEAFFGLIGKPPTFTRLRAMVSTMTRYYNISKAKRVLRYEPLWTLQEGIDRGVGWFMEEKKKEAAKKSQ
ncbi:NAD(P)-binding protein [Trichoderma longibrachiatum ATCC 18648]|uniref:NAD(P)-binding protein n=1 Tax=Trichoderma longibrachiatum ATCC 18648 TaxID=983965 RepID=A0A2T4C9A0_TRILO|nr:NAD(P)-binding protein [Trichoderma longibrachiatum ATCC 18648]